MKRRSVLLAAVMLACSAANAPAQTPAPVVSPDEVLSSGTRTFQIPGMSFDGTIAIAAYGIEFVSDEAAERAFRPATDGVAEQLAPDGLAEVSAPAIGDESEALAGAAAIGDGEMTAEIGLVTYRSGSVVVVVFAAALAGSPVEDAITTAQNAAERAPGPAMSQASPEPNEMRTDGVFGALPTLDDVPPGLAFVSDEVEEMGVDDDPR